MNRLVLAGAVFLTVTGVAFDVAAECHTNQYWDGAAVRGIQAARAGDRVVARHGGDVLVVDLMGNIINQYEDLATDHLIGGDQGFFEVATRGAYVAVTRLGMDGVPVATEIVLNESSPDVMNIAQAAYSHGVLAVTWAEPQALYAAARDIHVVLLAADGGRLADHVIEGRDGAYYAIPAAQGEVIWILWREDPYLRLEGMRFSTVSGQSLDAEPIAIAEGFNGFQVATVGDRLRLYADDPSNQIQVFELLEDGAVTNKGYFDGQVGRQILGLPSGELLHVDGPYLDWDDFPVLGATTLERESVAGELSGFLQFAAAEAVALQVDGELLVVSAEDSVDGREGVSRLMMRKVSLTGQVVAETELDQTALELVDYQSCDDDNEEYYYDGCNAGAGHDATQLPVLLLLAGFLTRRRR